MVTCHTYPDKFIRDIVIVKFLLLSDVKGTI